MSCIVTILEAGSFISAEDILYHRLLTIDPNFVPSVDFFQMVGDENFEDFNKLWIIKRDHIIRGTIFKSSNNLNTICNIIETSTAKHFECRILDSDNKIQKTWYPCIGWKTYTQTNADYKTFETYKHCDLFTTGNLCVDSGLMDDSDVPEPNLCA